MTEAQLQTIERELGVRLPEGYNVLSREFGGRMGELYDDPEDVIRATRYPMEASDYDRANWKASYVAIGDSGAGDLYLLDTAQESSPVYVLSHEDLSIIEEYANCAAFASDWQAWEDKTAREAQEKAEQERERSRNRRVFFITMFAMIVLSLALLPLIIFGPRAGIPRLLGGLLGLAAFLLLANTMARAIRGGVHY